MTRESANSHSPSSLRRRRDEKSSRIDLSYCNVQDSESISIRSSSDTRGRLRRFLLSLAVVSVVLNKVVLSFELLDFSHFSSYFWFPSVFWLDIIFLFIIHHGCTRNWSLVVVVMTLMVVFTVLVVAVQVTAIIGHDSTMPWALSVWALTEWEHFGAMVRAKASEAYIQVWMVALAQVVWAVLLSSLLFRSSVMTRRAPTTTLPCLHYPPSMSPRWSMHIKPIILCLVYILLVFMFRPQMPYDKLSQTPCFAVPVEILKGFQDYHHHMAHGEAQRQGLQKPVTHQLPPASSSNNNTESLNVILLFMESTRADVMPFDGSTKWAQRFVPDKSVHGNITPFMSNWTARNDTLYIPLIKTASGLTHKSLLSTLCSMHALPIQGTVEPFYSLYHACLPQLLGNFSNMFAQPQTEGFEHQKDLLAKIGFSRFFGQESYENMTQPSDFFKKLHIANYFGYEDNVMLPILHNWIKEQTTPFFLAYLCGITHDPHTIPPIIDWAPQQFSPDERVNGYLNTVSYMDQWLESFLKDVVNLDSTLVVILGDHGGSFYDRGSEFGAFDIKYEEALNVGISFHSRSPQWRALLRKRRSEKVSTDGNYTSIDVVPTILEVLGIGDDVSRSGKNKDSWVDGQSMLHPSGQRLRLSIPNPGYTMVLRDRSFVLVRRLHDTPEAFDLAVDPEQKNPLFIAPGQTQEEPLGLWGEKAVSFLQFVNEDLTSSYMAGKRCKENCTLSLMLSLESLDDWSPDMASSSSQMSYEPEWEYQYDASEDDYNE